MQRQFALCVHLLPSPEPFHTHQLLFEEPRPQVQRSHHHSLLGCLYLCLGEAESKFSILLTSVTRRSQRTIQTAEELRFPAENRLSQTTALPPSHKQNTWTAKMGIYRATSAPPPQSRKESKLSGKLRNMSPATKTTAHKSNNPASSDGSTRDPQMLLPIDWSVILHNHHSSQPQILGAPNSPSRVRRILWGTKAP